ncbi:MAG: hypothetical protein V4629_07235 [Pseudomonadota bacterium]
MSVQAINILDFSGKPALTADVFLDPKAHKSEKFVEVFSLQSSPLIDKSQSMDSIVQTVLLKLRGSYLDQQYKLGELMQNYNPGDMKALFKLQMTMIDITAIMKVQYGGASKLSEAFSTLLKS